MSSQSASDYRHAKASEDSASEAPERPKRPAAAPWQLAGEGVILVFKFRKSWVEEHGFLQSEQQGNFKGGLGYVMMVNYHSSPVGPYKELLIIPGKFSPHGRQSISRIFVDSQASTDNGRFNWGIPKETLPIDWHSEKKTDTFCVGSEPNPVFSCRIRSRGMPFPVTTKLLPIRLYQELDGLNYRTNPHGTGWGKLARIEHLEVNPAVFPDIRQVRPLACIKVNPFAMHFPKAS